MAINYSELKKNPIVLPMVEVAIDGLPDAVLVHQFTINQMKKVNAARTDEMSEDEFRNQILMFFRGSEFEPSQDDRDALSDQFSAYQLRDIYVKAMRLNGLGPSALRDAEKN